jgi:hypothetical protein
VACPDSKDVWCAEQKFTEGEELAHGFELGVLLAGLLIAILIFYFKFHQ